MIVIPCPALWTRPVSTATNSRRKDGTTAATAAKPSRKDASVAQIRSEEERLGVSGVGRSLIDVG